MLFDCLALYMMQQGHVIYIQDPPEAIPAPITGHSVAQHPVWRPSHDPSAWSVVSEPSNTSDQLISMFLNP